MVASKELKINIEKFSPHPTKSRTVLLFSASFLRLFEVVPQDKTFQESLALVQPRAEREAKFLDFCWVSNKYCNFLLVLQTNNKVMMFINDQLLKTIDIDLSHINLVDVTAQVKMANEVDDTFGFGNIIEDAIKDKLDLSNKFWGVNFFKPPNPS